MTQPGESFSQRVQSRARELGRALQNALELTRLGRGAEPARTPYVAVRNERTYCLRHYAAQPGRPKVEHPLLLVPSLMVSADLFDLSPESSAVQFLTRQGIDTWLCDFTPHGHHALGSPKTQDDYTHAVEACLDTVRELTGRDPHLAGHSQGGMLAYQVAALRRGEGIKSLITLCAPVDLHQNTSLDPDLFSRGVELVRTGALRSLRRLDALPSSAMELLFRAISIERALRARSRERALSRRTRHNEAEHDEEMAAHRHVLGHRAFAAWSGPALSTFADELLLSNRLLQGGFLVQGKVCSLSDLNLPLLYFVAERDDVARPAAVRAIARAAPQIQELYEISVGSGHVGVLIGRRAFEITWPSVVAWLRWREGSGPKPSSLLGQERKGGVGQALHELTYGLELVRDASTSVARSLARGVQSATRESLKLSESLRLQVLRLARLEQLKPRTRISFGLLLAEKAARNPDAPWFMYDGRGQTFRDADLRVDNVVRGLIACGVRPQQHVGVLMNNRPSYLSLVTALSRLGAVAVLLSPHSERASLQHALSLSPIDALVSDPENVQRAKSSFAGKLLLLGAPRSPRPNLADVVDMEAIDPGAVELPEWYSPNPGCAEDLAMIVYTAGLDDAPRATRVTNRKWAVAAYSAAAFSALSAKDTVYACTPLHHAASMLVAVGGALVGDARLALAERFRPETFWAEVRRYGISVVFYNGDMLRELTLAPSSRGEQHNPIRLFAGSGMRADTQRRLLQRFGEVKVLEFYASAEGPGVLANSTAKKVGAFGRPTEGAGRILLAAYDFDADRLTRDGTGLCVEAGDDEPAVLLARVDSTHAQTLYDATPDRQESESLVRDVLEPGDTWFFTGEVMRRDPQGDFWPLDRVVDVIHTPQGLAFTRAIEDVLYELPDVKVAVVAASREARGQQKPEASVVTYKNRELQADTLTRLVTQHLSPNERPRRVRRVEEVAMTDGMRPMKRGVHDGSEPLALYVYDEARGRYFRAQGEEDSLHQPELH